MSLVVLLGGHGVGKSTALKRWKTRYQSLETFSLDDLRKEYYDNEAKVGLVERLLNNGSVGVVETAKGYSAFMKAIQDSPIILALPSNAELGGRWMIERKGKPLSDWWNLERLQYELVDKFLNFVDKNGLADQTKTFRLNTREDWPAVDEYFGKLYRRLNNEMIRSRR